MSSWGKYGDANKHQRYKQPFKSLSKCDCGNRKTHKGMANGVCLCAGCELCMERWIRDGYKRNKGCRATK